ncbi:proton-transporting ATP synthase [Aureococcus anophagefferens]|nr:proton-transporting ATP synthase [Aureococcus anophagefferens]
MARLIVALACLFGASAFVSKTGPAAVQRVSAPAPLQMGKGGELRDRIATVGNTQKITEAMRLVAAAKVSREMLNNFLDGETDKVELIYTKFVSLIASSPSIRTILPLSATGIETEGDEIFEMSTKDGDFEESVASELASRMQSMQSASDNAKDLKKSLSQTYNRIRQAGVTQEILEIVAGATAAQG